MTWNSAVCVLALAMLCSSVLSREVGVYYGRNVRNIPSSIRVKEFLIKDLNYSIPSIRMADANVEILELLRGSNLGVTVGISNEDIQSIASSQYVAQNWVQEHIKPFIGPEGKGSVNFRFITVGHNAIPSNVSTSVLPAMTIVHNALISAGLADKIKVTTIVASHVLGSSHPPSSGSFARNDYYKMRDVTEFLYRIGSPLFIEVYPYFALVSDPKNISTVYALFESKKPVVIDGKCEYYNMFDAVLDSFVAAMVRVVGKEDIKVVAVSGWPTRGNPYATVANAKTYNNNLIKHVERVGRTPRKADIDLEVYINSLLDEDLNVDPKERCFGTFNPDLTEKYPLWH